MVAAPPKERVVAVELKSVAVVWVVVKSPPFTATSSETVKVPVLTVEPWIVVFPDESTLKYLVPPPLLVTLKISTEPEEAWATERPTAVAAVGVIV